jgi:hypothetical protein
VVCVTLFSGGLRISPQVKNRVQFPNAQYDIKKNNDVKSLNYALQFDGRTFVSEKWRKLSIWDITFNVLGHIIQGQNVQGCKNVQVRNVITLDKIFARNINKLSSWQIFKGLHGEKCIKSKSLIFWLKLRTHCEGGLIKLQKCPVQSGNLLDVDLFVASEDECLSKCSRVPTCLYYYFYTAPLR